MYHIISSRVPLVVRESCFGNIKPDQSSWPRCPVLALLTTSLVSPQPGSSLPRGKCGHRNCIEDKVVKRWFGNQNKHFIVSPPSVIKIPCSEFAGWVLSLGGSCWICLNFKQVESSANWHAGDLDAQVLLCPCVLCDLQPTASLLGASSLFIGWEGS